MNTKPLIDFKGILWTSEELEEYLERAMDDLEALPVKFSEARATLRAYEMHEVYLNEMREQICAVLHAARASVDEGVY